MLDTVKLYLSRRCPLFPVQKFFANSVDLNKFTSPLHFKSAESIKYEVDLNQSMDRQLFLYGNYELNCIRWIKKLLQPGMTFFDVGANVGNYTLVAAALVGPKGSVHAFEPSSGNYARLARNVALNPDLADRITMNNLAIGATLGTAPLYQTTGGNLTPSLVRNYNSSTSVEKVSVTTLDDYVSNHKLDEVNFIKIDIEGFEGEALKGSQRLLGSNSLKCVMCELNEDALSKAGTSPEAIVATFSANGFKMFWPRAFPRPMTRLQRAPKGVMDNFFFIRN